MYLTPTKSFSLPCPSSPPPPLPQCSGKTDKLKVSSVAFSSNPVHPGTTLTITVSGTPTVAITSGATMKTDIKLGSFAVQTSTQNFCSLSGIVCPVAAGTAITASWNVAVSGTAPSGSYTAEVSTVNGDKSAVSCIDSPFTVSASFEEEEEQSWEPLPLTLSHAEVLSENRIASLFRSFKITHGRVYEHAAEEALRFEHFKNSLSRIQARNKGLVSDDLNFGVTKFSDMSVEEFKEQMLTSKQSERASHLDANVLPYSSVERKLRGTSILGATPTSFDWRDQKMVTPVKDQGSCGSCWAFSTGEVIESAYAIAGHPLTELSIQQVVSCDTVDGGCRGGDTITAFDYVQKAGGLCSEDDFPYTSGRGLTGKCQTTCSPVAGTNIASWAYATPECTGPCNGQDEAALAATLSTVGPPSICVNAEPWQDYTTGVMKGSSCSHSYNDLDHCVQLIGYNGIDKSTGYWIARNSWNTNWGVEGMIHLEFGQNTCGVSDEATVVTLK